MPEITGRLRTPRLTSAPASPVAGEMYYDTTTNKLLWWNGTTWVDSTGGGATITAAAGRWVSTAPVAPAAGAFQVQPLAADPAKAPDASYALVATGGGHAVVIPADGYYDVSAYGQINPPSTAALYVSIVKNGTSMALEGSSSCPGLIRVTPSLTAWLLAGDQITLQMYCNLAGSAVISANLSVARVGGPKGDTGAAGAGVPSAVANGGGGVVTTLPMPVGTFVLLPPGGLNSNSAGAVVNADKTITIPNAGAYLFIATVGYGQAAGTEVGLEVRLVFGSGSTVPGAGNYAGLSTMYGTAYQECSVSALVNVPAGGGKFGIACQVNVGTVAFSAYVMTYALMRVG